MFIKICCPRKSKRKTTFLYSPSEVHLELHGRTLCLLWNSSYNGKCVFLPPLSMCAMFWKTPKVLVIEFKVNVIFFNQWGAEPGLKFWKCSEGQQLQLPLLEPSVSRRKLSIYDCTTLNCTTVPPPRYIGATFQCTRLSALALCTRLHCTEPQKMSKYQNKLYTS